MKRILVIIFLLCVKMAVYGQLSFTFLPELYGRNADGLGSFQVMNRSIDKMPGKVIISVSEIRTNSAVLTVTTPEYIFNPGLNNFPKTVFSRSQFSFSPNGYGAIVSQTRNLPPAEYSFCYRFVPTDKTLFNEQEDCFDGEIQPLVPISLLDPEHLDTICEKRPGLSWQPPVPFSQDMRYRLILTEKKGDDLAMEDLVMKKPVLLLDNISTNRINYPTANPELKEGSTYFWQVIVYQKGLIISKSEIWEFTVKCKEEKPLTPQDSFRELKLLINGNYYIANRAIRFSFRNDYNITKLKYRIYDISKGNEEIQNVPEIRLQQGFNKVEINLTDLDLIPGQQYILKVYPFNEPALELRFVYQDNDLGL